MTQTEKVSIILSSLNLVTSEFIKKLSDQELKNLRATIGCKEAMIARSYKKRIHCKTHFKPENKKAD